MNVKLLPRWVTVTGIVIAAAAAVVDPATTPILVGVLGAKAAAKVGLIGALVSAMGRALIPPSDKPEPVKQ